MSSAQIREEINREVALLPHGKEQQVLEFVRFLRVSKPMATIHGSTLRDLRGVLSSDQAQEMMEAIEEGCEQIDEESWK